jgi:hypothetical protein
LKDKLYRLQKKYDDTSYNRFLPKTIETIKHRAIGRNYELKYPPSPKYSGSLTDGRIFPEGDLNNLPLKEWTGIEKEDFIVEMDLSDLNNVKEIKAGFLQKNESWVFLPSLVTLETSKDGIHYSLLKRLKSNASERQGRAFKKSFIFKLSGSRLNKIRITAKNIERVPEWHQGAGGKTWVFCDEIIVN